jgi:hypothetical protein
MQPVPNRFCRLGAVLRSPSGLDQLTQAGRHGKRSEMVHILCQFMVSRVFDRENVEAMSLQATPGGIANPSFHGKPVVPPLPQSLLGGSFGKTAQVLRHEKLMHIPAGAGQ